MPGIAEIALGAAPIAGGALLGVIAGNLKGPDVRAGIKQDLELLERIPPEDADRRARLQASIDQRIDDLIHTNAKTRALREAAASYSGSWRDIFMFACAVLFTVVWWHVDHDRTNWLVVFVVLILLSITAALYALRGVGRALGKLVGRRKT